MSTLATNALLGTSSSNWAINLPSNNYINAPGHILQTQWVRTPTQTTYGVAVTGNGTTMSALAITITPRSASSLLICSWMINYEVGENATFLVHKDGALITTAGYQAYNNVVGNLRYSGVMNAMYDADNSTTPSNGYMQYAVISGSTAAATYAPAIRGTGASALTLYLNRAVSSAGTDGQEVTVSTGVIMEIAQ
jgi:hypothetical protein